MPLQVPDTEDAKTFHVFFFDTRYSTATVCRVSDRAFGTVHISI